MKWEKGKFMQGSFMMTKERWESLERGNNIDGPHLTPEEIKAGWHFCVEWDGMLIGPGMSEMRACICDIPVRVMLKGKGDNWNPNREKQ